MTAKAEALERLRSAEWLRRPETQMLFGLLDGKEHRTRGVGGIVRDTLLGRLHAKTDVDLATELLPQEVVRRAAAAGVAAYPTGIEHGTVTLSAGGLTAEVTSLREDVETDGRHAVVRFGTDWRRDAERRDFTLNALYADAKGELFDPLGGLEDCLAGRVRFIGDPDKRIAEDRLRVYRFFRFSASHGGESCDPEGLAACRRAAGDLSGLSAERVGTEMRRMLALPKVAQTLAAMHEAGLLQDAPEALGQLKAYEGAAETPLLAGRLAIFIAAEGQERVQARWRLGNSEVKAAAALLSAANLLERGLFHEAAYRHGTVAGEAVPVAAALYGWTADAVAEARSRLAGMAVPAFPVAAGDLMRAGLKPGPRIGSELARLEREWIESGFALDRQTLLDSVKS